MRRSWIMFLAILPGACDDVSQQVRQDRRWPVPMTYMTADVRAVSLRQNPLPWHLRDVMCTEPSPDVIRVLGQKDSLDLSGGNGAANGKISGTFSTTEAAAELAGRSAALLGLRDGLYRACETYANGAIGNDAYSLVLSRYGELMTTLFLGQDIASATVATLARTETPDKSAATPTAGTDGSTGMTTSTADKKVVPQSYLSPEATSGLLQKIAFGPMPKRKPRAKSASTTSVDGGGAIAASAMTAPAALEEMQRNYLQLDQTAAVIHVLLVACINDADRTRADGWQPASSDGRTVVFIRNPFLETMCQKLPTFLSMLMSGGAR